MGCASSVGAPVVQSAPTDYTGDMTGAAAPGSDRRDVNQHHSSHPDGHLILSEVCPIIYYVM